jgi:hypothetical protein
MYSKFLRRGTLALLIVTLLSYQFLGLGPRRLTPVLKRVHAQTAPPELTPNDPAYSDPNTAAAMKALDAPAAWMFGKTADQTAGSVVTDHPIVAVMGQSIDCDHSELRGLCLTQYNKNFTSDPSYDDDAPDHETGTSALIAGGFNNANQAVSVAGINGHVRIIGIKVISASGTGTEAWMQQGLQYVDYLKNVQKLNIILVNCSFSGEGPDSNPTETRKWLQALNSDRIVVIVSLRGSSTAPGSVDDQQISLASYAREFPNVVAVTMLSSDGQTLSTVARWGVKTVAFAAPAENIREATFPDRPDITASGSGPSVAVPEVAGVIALVVIYKEPDPLVALDRVKGTARMPSALLGKVGFGVPDAYAALTRDFTAPASGLSLFTVPNSPRAVALDRMGLVDPFALDSPYVFDGDRRNRVMFFSPNTDVVSAQNVSVELKNLQGATQNVPIEHVCAVPSNPNFAQITIRLPDQAAGEYWATLVSGTMRSNSVIVSFQ